MQISSEIIVAVLSLIGTLGGSFGGIIVANKLTNYRIEQLEKKVEKHNSYVQRTFVLEEKMSEAERRLDVIEKRASHV